MTWYSLSKLSKELGMSINTFKKYYLAQYPPDRVTANYKGWCGASVERIKSEIQGT